MNCCELISYGKWRRNLRLSNGLIELVVTLDVGPRILRCGFVGERNLFGEFPEQLGKSGEKKWMIRGGHRLWVAPEKKPHTYEPDNGPVEFRRVRGGVRVIGTPGPLTGIRKTIEIRLDPKSARVAVTHVLTNAGRKPVECAAWALSVMAARGVAVIPLPPLVAHDQRVTPNQNWSLWGYTDLSDPRISIKPPFLQVGQDPKRGPTKLGLAVREGWASYWVDGYLFVKRFVRDDRRTYPDGNVNFEVYTDKRILELETLGPLTVLKPSRSVKHEEEWLLFRDAAPRS